MPTEEREEKPTADEPADHHDATGRQKGGRHQDGANGASRDAPSDSPVSGNMDHTEDTQNQAGKTNVHPFWGNIFKYFRFSTDADEFQILRNVPLFKNLSKRELRTVSSLLYERHYEPGEYIFQMHQPGAAMFIIEKGRIKIVHENEQGDEVELADLCDGEFLGELALLDNSPRSASAIALEKSRLLAVFRADLDKLLMSEPVIGGKVIKQLAIIIGMRLKATNEQLSSIKKQDDGIKT